jgi:hypothetical protein
MSTCRDARPSQRSIEAAVQYIDWAYGILKIQQSGRVQSKQADLASWNPVDKDEWGGGSAILVHEVVGKHDISRRSLGELCK